ncbi:variable large family protein (plasmid) [Borrelia coriaceae]|uniref:Variable large protein n=1 Tax=Borrelia coriaceae ATCC 43381 TaxID=1408429 RepID=W5T2Z4_9SPIR|nr:variable large family protein [Borrelia coriaceae]AHH11691.1 Variable outer membrane protein [Borrelia coriaceae ATCC 43381]UPA17180.1 variable large family protein [Borrelia coriaceae]
MKINIKNIKVKRICATLFISLFLSCNNGIEELEKRNSFLSSLANLGNDFLSIFISFGDMTGTVLGFNTTTKKSDVGNYFTKVKEAVEGVKGKLNTIVESMKSSNNPNAVGVETAVKTLIDNTLDKIIEGAKTVSGAIGTTGDELLGNGSADKTKGGAAGDVDKLVEGMKEIVKLVLGEKGDPNAGDGKKAGNNVEDRTGGSAQGEAGKLFHDSGNSSGIGSSANDAKKAAADAAKAVGSVTGADILQAIVTYGKTMATKATEARAKDATIAGAIALRAMTKDGKFPGVASGGVAADDADYQVAVKGVALSAVTKALDTLTIAIRETIDAGLKTVKKAMNINPEATPVTTESVTATK